MLATDPDIELVAQAPDGPTAVSLAMELRPDVVLMDVDIRNGDRMTRLGPTRQIQGRSPASGLL